MTHKIQCTFQNSESRTVVYWSRHLSCHVSVIFTWSGKWLSHFNFQSWLPSYFVDVCFMWFLSYHCGIIRAKFLNFVAEKKNFIFWMLLTKQAQIQWYIWSRPCCDMSLFCGSQVLWPSETTSLLLLQWRKRKPQWMKLMNVRVFLL